MDRSSGAIDVRPFDRVHSDACPLFDETGHCDDGSRLQGRSIPAISYGDTVTGEMRIYCASQVVKPNGTTTHPSTDATVYSLTMGNSTPITLSLNRRIVACANRIVSMRMETFCQTQPRSLRQEISLPRHHLH